jgi:hypothetical protein
MLLTMFVPACSIPAPKIVMKTPIITMIKAVIAIQSTVIAPLWSSRNFISHLDIVETMKLKGAARSNARDTCVCAVRNAA